jgi:hypothetical protein
MTGNFTLNSPLPPGRTQIKEDEKEARKKNFQVSLTNQTIKTDA